MTTVDDRPGLSLARLARLATAAVERCQLDLTGAAVLTEAASGPYVVTPVLAALAGADVTAVTRTTRYGTVEQIRDQTMTLARSLGVADRITVTDMRSPELFGKADVITNSGNLRPITGEFADAIRPSAVVSLMFEAWEIQAGRIDVDLDRLRTIGVEFAGTNERHPAVDVFSFLGPAAVAALADAGVSAYKGRIAVLCDNAFRDYLVTGITAVGAEVVAAAGFDELVDRVGGDAPDGIVVAMTPTGSSVLDAGELARIGTLWPDTVAIQYWGDIDRDSARGARVACWPIDAPGAGHMGVLPSRVGPEPIVRLQAGGLKVAEVLRVPAERRTSDQLAYVDQL